MTDFLKYSYLNYPVFSVSFEKERELSMATNFVGNKKIGCRPGGVMTENPDPQHYAVITVNPISTNV